MLAIQFLLSLYMLNDMRNLRLCLAGKAFVAGCTISLTSSAGVIGEDATVLAAVGVLLLGGGRQGLP